MVELLVVMLLMTILLSIGAGIVRGAAGKGVSAALATTEASFDEARAIALGKGTKARVLIDAKDPESDTYLRRVLISYEALDENGEPSGTWELSGRGITLPDRTFFSQDLSMENHENGTQLTEQSFTFNKSAFDGIYYAYEFNAEGICSTPGASFVIGAGARAPGDKNPVTTSDGRRDFAGFVIWRNGATSVFRSVDQILKGGGDPKEF